MDEKQLTCLRKMTKSLMIKSTDLRTIFEQARPQSQWNLWVIWGTAINIWSVPDIFTVNQSKHNDFFSYYFRWKCILQLVEDSCTLLVCQQHGYKHPYITQVSTKCIDKDNTYSNSEIFSTTLCICNANTCKSNTYCNTVCVKQHRRMPE